MDYQDTGLWQLLARPEDAGESRLALMEAFRSFHTAASSLAEEIRISMPRLTEHGTPHLDALWQMADLIAGQDLVLSATEVFVFGGAVLLHDLGLGVAAYPGGPEAIQQGVEWDAAVNVIIRQTTGESPDRTQIENAEDSVRAQALELVLRSRHAKQAALLGTMAWSLEGEQRFLIGDPDLRATYGGLIGQIAASHWEDARSLPDLLPPIFGAMAGFPADWTVRPVLLAGLLRTADAAHLDARRAPSWAMTFRRLTGVSLEHWRFQNKLNVPVVDGEKLLYTSGRPFQKAEAQAWWLCFEALRVADSELVTVDELLIEEGLPRFARRGVVDTTAPDRLARHIRTEGWEPVDIAVRISDPVNLIERLGGEDLYGSGSLAPLRELIQNAADAVRARRAMEGKTPTWGRIVVRSDQDQDGRFLEVRDGGKGMSRHVLTRTLLDFGASLWSSTDLVEESPELLANGFEAVGRFGIGFFAAFMWSSRIVVTSRRPRDSADDTFVLEITDGLRSRPLVRRAEPGEQLPDGGTTVRLYLKSDVDLNAPGWGVDDGTDGDIDISGLARLCCWLCPTLDVTLDVETRGVTLGAVTASDWMYLRDDELLERLSGGHENVHLSEMHNADGTLVGRAALAQYGRGGVVTVGGFRASSFTFTTGVLLGRDPNLARDRATATVERAAFDQWLGEQLALNADQLGPQWANTALAYGHDVGTLPVCSSSTGRLSAAALTRLASSHDDWLLVTQHDIDQAYADAGFREELDFDLHDGVLLVPEDMVGFETAGFAPTGKPGVWQVIRHAIARGWDVAVDELVEDNTELEVGLTERGDEVAASVRVLTKPA